jgi:hypothetical protein
MQHKIRVCCAQLMLTHAIGLTGSCYAEFVRKTAPAGAKQAFMFHGLGQGRGREGTLAPAGHALQGWTVLHHERSKQAIKYLQRPFARQMVVFTPHGVLVSLSQSQSVIGSWE